MAIQMVRAPSAATTVVPVDTDTGKLEVAKRVGADDALLSGEEAPRGTPDATEIAPGHQLGCGRCT
jgi:alcohol dehydrogenase, propanol-preferring